MLNNFFKKTWPVAFASALLGIGIGLGVSYLAIGNGNVWEAFEGKINLSTTLQVITTICIGGYFSLVVSKLNSEVVLKNSNDRVVKDELMRYCMDGIRLLENINKLIDPFYLQEVVKAGFLVQRKSDLVELPINNSREANSTRDELNLVIATILHILDRHEVIELYSIADIDLHPESRPKNFSKEISSICSSCQTSLRDYWEIITNRNGNNLLEPIKRDAFILAHTLSQQKRHEIIRNIHDLRSEINRHKSY